MSAAPGERFEVGDLDPAGVLARPRNPTGWCCSGSQVAALELAHQWAVLHPATEDTGVETPGGPGLGVLDADETLGGDGTPQVAAFAPEVPRRRDGLSPAAARNLMADSLDLPHRHPNCGNAYADCRSPPGRPGASSSRPGACRRPVRGGSTTSSPTGSAAARSSPTGSSPRPPPSSTPKNTNAAKTKPLLQPTSNCHTLSRASTPGPATSPPTATPSPCKPSTTWSVPSPTSCSSTATQRPWVSGRSRPSA